MKVGTDSVLFGAWVAGDCACKQILDVGAGTGILSLIMAQRMPDAEIMALEIDADAAFQADENIKASLWKERMGVIAQDFCMFDTLSRFDLILSNPPYFQDSLLSSCEKRNRARHTVSLPYKELISKAATLLSDEGVFAVIIPVEYASEIRSIAYGEGLYTSRQAEVFTKEGGEVKRVMMEFSRKLQLCKTEQIVIRSLEGTYTSKFTDLVSGIYRSEYLNTHLIL